MPKMKSKTLIASSSRRSKSQNPAVAATSEYPVASTRFHSLAPHFKITDSTTSIPLTRSLNALLTALRHIRYPIRDLSTEALCSGQPQAYLHILHFLFCNFSPYVEKYLHTHQYTVFYKTDQRFLQSIFDFSRQHLNLQPKLTVYQFLSTKQFGLAKLILCNDIVRAVGKLHNELFRKQKHSSSRQSSKQHSLMNGTQSITTTHTNVASTETIPRTRQQKQSKLSTTDTIPVSKSVLKGSLTTSQPASHFKDEVPTKNYAIGSQSRPPPLPHESYGTDANFTSENDAVRSLSFDVKSSASLEAVSYMCRQFLQILGTVQGTIHAIDCRLQSAERKLQDQLLYSNNRIASLESRFTELMEKLPFLKMANFHQNEHSPYPASCHFKCCLQSSVNSSCNQEICRKSIHQCAQHQPQTSTHLNNTLSEIKTYADPCVTDISKAEWLPSTPPVPMTYPLNNCVKQCTDEFQSGDLAKKYQNLCEVARHYGLDTALNGETHLTTNDASSTMLKEQTSNISMLGPNCTMEKNDNRNLLNSSGNSQICMTHASLREPSGLSSLHGDYASEKQTPTFGLDYSHSTEGHLSWSDGGISEIAPESIQSRLSSSCQAPNKNSSSLTCKSHNGRDASSAPDRTMAVTVTSDEAIDIPWIDKTKALLDVISQRLESTDMLLEKSRSLRKA